VQAGGVLQPRAQERELGGKGDRARPALRASFANFSSTAARMNEERVHGPADVDAPGAGLVHQREQLGREAKGQEW
jgi:hypothetical protein